MKKLILILLVLTLALSLSPASAEPSPLLGQPFADFTVSDADGILFFSLSSALKTHDAVLINLWATWCPPCGREMPYLEAVYQQYSDRVAFIALSIEDTDTYEKIASYRDARGLHFPMGRDENASVYRRLGVTSIPATLIVDRFGKVGFLQTGSFMSADEIARLLDAFLGEDYTQTTVLTSIPADATTRAFPVSDDRAILVENEDARLVLFHEASDPVPQPVYIVPDDTAHLRLTLTALDDPSEAVYYNNYEDVRIVQSLLDPDQNAYLIDEPMPDPDFEDFYVCSVLIPGGSSARVPGVYLIPDDSCIEPLANAFRSSGYDITWEYADSALPGPSAPDAYSIRVVDQDGQSVPGVTVTFCTDSVCAMQTSDPDGNITFSGDPDIYHVQITKVPDGYAFDQDFELTTSAEYSQWLLRVRRLVQ